MIITKDNLNNLITTYSPEEIKSSNIVIITETLGPKQRFIYNDNTNDRNQIILNDANPFYLMTDILPNYFDNQVPNISDKVIDKVELGKIHDTLNYISKLSVGTAKSIQLSYYFEELKISSFNIYGIQTINSFIQPNAQDSIKQLFIIRFQEYMQNQLGVKSFPISDGNVTIETTDKIIFSTYKVAASDLTQLTLDNSDSKLPILNTISSSADYKTLVIPYNSISFGSLDLLKQQIVGYNKYLRNQVSNLIDSNKAIANYNLLEIEEQLNSFYDSVAACKYILKDKEITFFTRAGKPCNNTQTRCLDSGDKRNNYRIIGIQTGGAILSAEELDTIKNLQIVSNSPTARALFIDKLATNTIKPEVLLKNLYPPAEIVEDPALSGTWDLDFLSQGGTVAGSPGGLYVAAVAGSEDAFSEIRKITRNFQVQSDKINKKSNAGPADYVRAATSGTVSVVDSLYRLNLTRLAIELVYCKLGITSISDLILELILEKLGVNEFINLLQAFLTVNIETNEDELFYLELFGDLVYELLSKQHIASAEPMSLETINEIAAIGGNWITIKACVVVGKSTVSNPDAPTAVIMSKDGNGDPSFRIASANSLLTISGILVQSIKDAISGPTADDKAIKTIRGLINVFKLYMTDPIKRKKILNMIVNAMKHSGFPIETIKYIISAIELAFDLLVLGAEFLEESGILLTKEDKEMISNPAVFAMKLARNQKLIVLRIQRLLIKYLVGITIKLAEQLLLDALEKCKAVQDSNNSGNLSASFPSNQIEPDSINKFALLQEMIAKILNLVDPSALCSFMLKGQTLDDVTFKSIQAIVEQPKYNTINKPSEDIKTKLAIVIFRKQNIVDNQQSLRDFFTRINAVSQNQLFTACSNITSNTFTAVDLDCVPNGILDKYFTDDAEKQKYAASLTDALNKSLGMQANLTNEINNQAPIERDSDTNEMLNEQLKKLLSDTNSIFTVIYSIGVQSSGMMNVDKLLSNSDPNSPSIISTFKLPMTVVGYSESASLIDDQSEKIIKSVMPIAGIDPNVENSLQPINNEIYYSSLPDATTLLSYKDNKGNVINTLDVKQLSLQPSTSASLQFTEPGNPLQVQTTNYRYTPMSIYKSIAEDKAIELGVVIPLDSYDREAFTSNLSKFYEPYKNYAIYNKVIKDFYSPNAGEGSNTPQMNLDDAVQNGIMLTQSMIGIILNDFISHEPQNLQKNKQALETNFKKVLNDFINGDSDFKTSLTFGLKKLIRGEV